MTKKYKIKLHERIEEFMQELNKYSIIQEEESSKTINEDNERLKELKKYLNIK